MRYNVSNRRVDVAHLNLCHAMQMINNNNNNLISIGVHSLRVKYQIQQQPFTFFAVFLFMKRYNNSSALN